MDWRILNAKKTACCHRWWILAMGGCWIECTTRNSHWSTRLFVIYQRLAGWHKYPCALICRWLLYFIPKSLVLRMLAVYRKPWTHLHHGKTSGRWRLMLKNAMACVLLIHTHQGSKYFFFTGANEKKKPPSISLRGLFWGLRGHMVFH